LADKIVSDLREVDQTVVSLDGDILRELWGNDLGHDLESRRENAQRICRLCQFLDQQGLDVVCAILSIFPESREWCRQNLSSYYEVFIDAPLSQVMERDVKGIYSKYKNGEIKDVAGLDLEFPIPQKPDLVIKNVKRKEDLLSHAPIIKNQILRIK